MAVKKMSIPAIAWRGDWRENRGGRDMQKLNLDARKDRGVILSDHGYVASAGSATEG